MVAHFSGRMRTMRGRFTYENPGDPGRLRTLASDAMVLRQGLNLPMKQHLQRVELPPKLPPASFDAPSVVVAADRPAPGVVLATATSVFCLF